MQTVLSLSEEHGISSVYTQFLMHPQNLKTGSAPYESDPENGKSSNRVHFGDSKGGSSGSSNNSAATSPPLSNSE